MHVKFAENQLMIAQDSTAQTIRTSPVRIPPASQLSMVLTIEYIINITGNVAQLAVELEVSNNGVNWALESTAMFEKTAAGVYLNAYALGYEFVVVKLTLDPDSTSQSGTGIAGVMFDLDGRTYQL